MFCSLLLISSTIINEPVDHKIIGASLFKNGYAVVVRESKLTGDELMIESPPSATLGTLWVTGSEGVKIESVVATTIETKSDRTATTLDEILKANVGKIVTMVLRKVDESDTNKLIGKLIGAEGQIVIVQIQDGSTLVVNKSQVSRITGTTGALIYTVETTTKKSALRVRASGTGSVFTIALQRGLTWAPGYHVDISDPDKLTMTAKATLLNDNGDLEGVDVKLITGFPHVRFLGVPDPLTAGYSVDQFLNALTNSGGRIAAPSAMTQNFARARESKMSADAGGFASFDPGQLQGAQLEDLFFYTLEKVTLKKGERGYHVLFQEDAAYSHVYTLDLGYTNWENTSVTADGPFDVWHEIKFKNPTAFPFTTAAATTVKDGEVIGQDMLNYTSPGSEALLKITKALDLHAEILEEEVSRVRGAIKDTANRPLYDLVTGKATIEVTNFKTDDVKMKIEKTVVGEIQAVDQDGESTKQTKGLRAINATSRILWEPEIAAGKTWKTTYTFEVYVRALR